MSIDTVLFDLDDTLCDYRAARQRAKQKITVVLERHGIPDPAAFWAEFERSEPALFTKFADGQISKQDYRIGRFSSVLSAHVPGTSAAAEVDRIAAEANDLYIGSANTDIDLFDDVLPTFDELDDLGVRVGVLTNGPADGQRRKVRALGLDGRVPDIFISEELGHAKPAPEAFAAALTSLSSTPDRALMVGDSLATDVEGARASGLRALLLDRYEQHSETDAEVIRSLDELAPWLTGAHRTELRHG